MFQKDSSKESISFAEIPSRYETDLFRTAKDRYNMIKDVNFLCGANGDIRFQRANALIGEDATKGGFSIIVNGSMKDKQRSKKTGKKVAVQRESERIQKIADDFLERTGLHIYIEKKEIFSPLAKIIHTFIRGNSSAFPSGIAEANPL